MSSLPPSASASTIPSWRKGAVLFAAVVTLVLMVQSLTKVWTSDLGADPDEPAHAVTALMVRDYLASGFSSSPMTFAQAYYEDFPKVALGHYPPVYYAVGGLLLLPFPQPQVLLVFQALLAGALAWLVYLIGRRLAGERCGTAAAFMAVGFPVTLVQTQYVMADLLLTVLCLATVELWARYLEKPRVLLGLAFGLTAAAAILTKGSGLALAIVPVVSVLALRRWDLLRQLSFWLAGLPVVVLAGPWMAYSSRITKEGMVHTGVIEFAWQAMQYYSSVMSKSFGFTTLLVAVAGLGLWLGATKIRMKPDPRRACLLGLLVGTACIMLLIPAGTTSRYFLPIVPVVALLACSFFELAYRGSPLAKLGTFAIVALVWLQVPTMLVKNVNGYSAAVHAELPQVSGTEKTRWLVSADPRGEGAVIASAAFALKERSPSPLRIDRGSKVLSTSDWLGRDYKQAFENAPELLAWLAEKKVSRVFIQVPEDQAKLPAHDKQLLEALQGTPAWKLNNEVPTTRPYQEAPMTLRVYAPAQG